MGSIIRVGQRPRFTVIDRRAVNDERLSYRALGILLWILDKPDGWKIDSETLCATRKEGRDAVRSALKELLEAGYMEREKTQDAQGHWTTTITVRETAGHTDDGFPVVGNPTVGFPGAKTTNTENEDSLAQLPLSASETTTAFEQFWAIWPKRRGKAAAAKAHARAIRRASADDILAGARWVASRWSTMTASERQFVPYPERWLNGDRWLDDDISEVAPEVTDRVLPDPTCEQCGGDGWVTVEGTNDMVQCECRRPRV